MTLARALLTAVAITSSIYFLARVWRRVAKLRWSAASSSSSSTAPVKNTTAPFMSSSVRALFMVCERDAAEADVLSRTQHALRTDGALVWQRVLSVLHAAVHEVQGEVAQMSRGASVLRAVAVLCVRSAAHTRACGERLAPRAARARALLLDVLEGANNTAAGESNAMVATLLLLAEIEGEISRVYSMTRPAKSDAVPLGNGSEARRSLTLPKAVEAHAKTKDQLADPAVVRW